MGDRKDEFDKLNQIIGKEETNSPPTSPDPGHIPKFLFSATSVKRSQRAAIKDSSYETHDYLSESLNIRVLKYTAISQFLKKYPNLDFEKDEGFNAALIYAVNDSNSKVVEDLISCCDDNENFPEWQNKTKIFGFIMWQACRYFAGNDPETVRAEKLGIIKILLDHYQPMITSLNMAEFKIHVDLIENSFKIACANATKINKLFPSTVFQHNLELYWILYLKFKKEMEQSKNPIFNKFISGILYSSLIEVQQLLQKLEKQATIDLKSEFDKTTTSNEVLPKETLSTLPKENPTKESSTHAWSFGTLASSLSSSLSSLPSLPPFSSLSSIKSSISEYLPNFSGSYKTNVSVSETQKVSEKSAKSDVVNNLTAANALPQMINTMNIQKTLDYLNSWLNAISEAVNNSLVSPVTSAKEGEETEDSLLKIEDVGGGWFLVDKSISNNTEKSEDWELVESEIIESTAEPQMRQYFKERRKHDLTSIEEELHAFTKENIFVPNYSGGLRKKTDDNKEGNAIVTNPTENVSKKTARKNAGQR